LYEPVALKLATPRLSGDDIIDAERILIQCELSTIAQTRVKLALDFHMRLMLCCDDKSLLAKISKVHVAVLHVISDQASVVLAGERAQHQLWCLLECCRRRQTDRALDALRQVIGDACLSVSEIAGDVMTCSHPAICVPDVR
jgi:DNA-binding GntR family transcriptional regulator